MLKKHIFFAELSGMDIFYDKKVYRYDYAMLKGDFGTKIVTEDQKFRKMAQNGLLWLNFENPEFSLDLSYLSRKWSQMTWMG